MAKKSGTIKALLALLQQETGDDNFSQGDLARLLERYKGPHGHPQLVRSKRLQRKYPLLESVDVTPWGMPCLLWKVNDAVHGLRVDIGLKSWFLAFDEEAVCEGGRIIGFNENREPIVEMTSSPTGEYGCSYSMIYIGNRLLRHTNSQATTKTHQGWTMGADDGRLYCLEKASPASTLRRGDQRHYQHLAGYDPVSGERVTTGVELPNYGDIIESLGVRYQGAYAFMSNDVGSNKLPSLVMTGMNLRMVDRSTRKGTAVAAASSGLYAICPAAGPKESQAVMQCCVNEWIDDGMPELAYAYARGFSDVGDKERCFAYVTKRPGDLEAWAVHDVGLQPAFDQVSRLFRRFGRWYYWGLSQGHLFLMDLLPDRP